MRHEELHEHLEHGVARVRPPSSDVEHRTQAALSPGAPAALQRSAMLDLQRAAGNASAAALVEEDDPAAEVRGVIGGSGQPLDRDTRSFMESRLSADFSNVRVHTDGGAARSAQRLSAQAYTVGDNIVFGAGHYAPGTDSGKRVLAHELTHVVQQRSGPVSGTHTAGGLKVSDPADSFEQAAEHSAAQVMSGATGPAGATGSAGTSVQREPEEEELQMSALPPVQREPEEEELQMSAVPPVQREAEPEEEELQMCTQRQGVSEEAAEEEELAHT